MTSTRVEQLESALRSANKLMVSLKKLRADVEAMKAKREAEEEHNQ